MKKFLISALTIAVVGVGIYVTPFVMGKWSNKVDKAIGTEYTDNQREKFKHSKSYVEGMINDLSDYKREYERATDEAEKKQVLNYIDSHFANFDIDYVENDTLYKFLKDVRNGGLN